MNPRSLPVYDQRQRILSALTDHQVIVVESPTGSGKTTQIPLILHEAGYSSRGVVGVTQPRRIAAVSVCEYISSQTGTTPGDLAGYKMRFDDQTSPATRLKIMTDGILLQELKNDQLLSQYSVIMVDEAHERSLNIDFILGLLKRVLAERPEFRVIVSSATIKAETFSEYFDNSPVVRIESPMYPVDIRYEPPASDSSPEELIYRIVDVVERTIDEADEVDSEVDEVESELDEVDKEVDEVDKELDEVESELDEVDPEGGRVSQQKTAPGRKHQPAGDILIFLSGEKLIKDTIAALARSRVHKRLYLLPLYGRLSREEQDRVFPPAPPGKVKVVVATNIAETSITIDGITTVVDSGLAKLNHYNPKTYTSSLIEGPISKASADQRRGRAGRTQPGVCYRLYSQESYERREPFTTEEIYRTDLSEVVLRMAELGIQDFEHFDFISPPSRRGIEGAIETLELLSALGSDRTLTEIGERMARFPLSPRHSRIIVEAMEHYPDVIDEAVIAAAFLTSQTPFILPEGEETEARRAHHAFRDPRGDFVSYLKLLDAFRRTNKAEKFCRRYYLEPRAMLEIRNVADQLAEIVTEFGVPIGSGGPKADYLCAVATGLIQFVCIRSGRTQYRSMTADQIQIHPGSVMFRETPRYIVAGEIVRTSRTFARSVSPLERPWLKRISPSLAHRLEDQASAPGKRGGRKAEIPEKGEKR
ncbi:MAG: helicase-related protein, partial [Spirochaetia bacterium]